MKKKTRRVLAMVLVSAMVLQQSSVLGVMAVETEPETEAAAMAEASLEEATDAAVEQQTSGNEQETSESVTETPDPESGMPSEPQTSENATAMEETIPEEETQAAEERVTESDSENIEEMQTETEAVETEAQTETMTEQPAEIENITEAASEILETVMETEPVIEETLPEPVFAEPQTYKYEDSRAVIKVTVPKGVELPYGSELKAVPVPEGSKEYADAAAAVEAANPDVVFHKHVFYDIYFESDGREVEPVGGEVSVQIKLKDTLKTDTNTSGEPAVTVSHLKDDGNLEDVTDEVKLNKKDEVKSVRFSTDSFSIMGISAGVKDGYMTDDTLGDYSLEFLLRNFNLVSFGNVDMALHCMGGILVKGNLSGSASGFADSEFITEESFVKGYVSFMGKCNSRNHYRPDAWAFYVGAGSAENKNEITADGNGNYTVLNGMSGYNSLPDGGCGPVLMNDNYVDWTTLYNSVDGTMDALALKSVKTYTSDWDWSEITIPAGTNVSLNTNGHKVKIKLDGDTTATTIINVLDSGEVTVPQITGLSSQEDGNSMPVAFTFPNATAVKIVSELSPSFGHVIAPDATIDIGSCNYNGCVIGGNMTISGEGHMWPYTGGSLIPASGGFSAQKTVDGKVPAAGQTFNFTLEELEDGAWAEVETKQNDGSKVEFSKILYTDTADHWYLISEESGSGNYDYDDSVYAIHVTVEESTGDGGMKVYNVKGTEYYKVNDGVKKAALISGSGVDAGMLAKASGPDVVKFDNKEITRKEVQKVWAGDTDEERPESIRVQLKADGKGCGDAVTLNAGNGWHYAWEKLPKRKGTLEIAYTVEEVGTVDGYVSTSEVAGDITTITNTYDPGDTDMHVQKVWVDDNNRDGLRPDSITVQLYADGEAYGNAVALNAGNGWKYDWTGLPEKQGGKTVSYDVKETSSVPGYTTAYQASGKTVTVTNTHDTAKTSKSVVKVWEDDGNRDGLRPVSIKVQLKADGVDYGPEAVLNEGNHWSYSWTGLQENANGREIAYTVVETDQVAGYTATSTVDGNTTTITNHHEAGYTSMHVEKVWADDNNRDGLRPDSIDVQLYANGNTYGDAVVLNETNGWSYDWEDLPEKQAGKDVSYEVKETGTVVGYTTAYKTAGNTVTITNTHDIAKTSKSVVKVWKDDGNRDGLRPVSIKVQLEADGVDYGPEITLDEGNGWSHTWDGLPEKADGKTIAYTVTETSTVAGYTSASTVSGDVTTITNTHEAGYTSMGVRKVWEDDDNRDNLRPDSIEVQLYADHAAYGDAVTLNAENGWSYSWDSLPEKADGKTIDYDIKEVGVVRGYTAAYRLNGNIVTITNTHDIEKTGKSVKKVWQDDGDRDGLRPISVEVQLKADGMPVGEAVTLDADNDWSFRWDSLPVNNGGKAILYAVEETGKVTGYTAAYANEGDAFTITNTHDPEKTEATVKKVWDDEDNEDLIRPDAVNLALYADGKPTDTMVTLNEANQWTATATGLPKNARKDGRSAAIAYTWEENAVPAGYEVTGNTTDGTVTTVTNTHRVGTATYEVEKVWADTNNKDGIRPVSVKVQLLADGEAFGDTVILNAENGWHYAWTDLPEKKDGKLVVYTAEEVPVPEGYGASYENASGKTVITNTHIASTEIVLSVKKAFDGTLAAGQFSFKLEEAGGNGITMTAENAADGSVTFDKIVYDKAGTYRYNISEVIPDPKDASVIYDTSVKAVTVTVTEEDGMLKAVSDAKDSDMTFTNRLTSVRVSKTDITTGTELEGAHIQIIDKEGSIAEEWDSAKEAHEVKGLKVGETYMLRETLAPDGYTVTADTAFTLKDDGTVDSSNTTTASKDGMLLVEDSMNKVSILKVDEKGAALAGAKLVVKDKDGNAVGDTWLTDGTAHDVTGLAKGTYVLSEIAAPEGYRVSEDVPFEVTGKETAGQVITVEMKDSVIPKKHKRSLTVTKHLRLDGTTGEVGIRNAVYYVALFSDAEKTQRVSDVKQIVFDGATASSVTFENLGKGTYYVGETDGNGTLLASQMVNDLQVFYPEYNGSAEVKFEGGRSETANAEFTNVYVELTSGLYLSGQITVTKKILVNGKEGTSDETYYARIFTDAGLTEPASDVLALDMAGGSTKSVTVDNLFIGETLDGSQAYYVAETDENGIPLDPDKVTEFDISIDKSEVVLSANNSDQEVVITNSFTDDAETKNIAEAEAQGTVESPKTGDETELVKYLLLMFCSAIIGMTVTGVKFRKKKTEN